MNPATNEWAAISPEQKPSRAIGSDASRPEFLLGHIRHGAEESYLWCSDSYILAQIRLTMDCDPGEARHRILPEVSLPRETLLALDSGSRFRFANSHLEVEGRQSLFPVEFGAKRPRFDEILGRLSALNPKEVKSVRFNPALLSRLAEALGTSASAVELQFAGKNKAITVKPYATSLGTGCLMPVKS